MFIFFVILFTLKSVFPLFLKKKPIDINITITMLLIPVNLT